MEAAISLGMALRLTDALNCVGHHRRTLGTCTIPRDLLLRHRISEHELEQNLLGDSESLTGDPRWQGLMRELLSPVRPLLRRAATGGEKLPAGARVAVRAAVRMCHRVVVAIEGHEYDSIRKRTKMFSWRSLGDMAGAFLDSGVDSLEEPGGSGA